MGLELGGVAVRQARQLLHALVAGHGAQRRAAGRRPRRLALDGRAQQGIAAEGVEAGRRLRLVKHLVRAVAIGSHFEDLMRKGLIHACLR